MYFTLGKIIATLLFIIVILTPFIKEVRVFMQEILEDFKPETLLGISFLEVFVSFEKEKKEPLIFAIAYIIFVLFMLLFAIITIFLYPLIMVIIFLYLIADKY